MKNPMTAFTYRQKEITVQLACNTVILLLFLLHLATHWGPRNIAPALLAISWYLPHMYTLLKLHTTEDTRTDERDREIEAGGTRDGYGFLSFGVWLLLWWADQPGRLLDELFLLWLVSRIFADARRLRLYAGHTSWLPDSVMTRLRHRALQRVEHPTPRQLETARKFMERERRKGRL